MSSPPSSWKPFDPSGLRDRLQQVRALLIQAAAVGLAQDTERVARIAELGRATTTPPPLRPRPPR